MSVRPSDAVDAPAAAGGYAQAVKLVDHRRLLFVSGQIPVDADSVTPEAFSDQCHLAWRNVEAQLRAAGMGIANLVKVTIFLADRRDVENRTIRQAVLGDHRPAMTVIITGIFDEVWLLEIEAVAAA